MPFLAGKKGKTGGNGHKHPQPRPRHVPGKKPMDKNSPKYKKYKSKKLSAQEKTAQNVRKMIANMKKTTTFMVSNNSIGVPILNLKSLWRIIHANVVHTYPKFNADTIGNPVGKPHLGPTGFAAYLAWAFLTAVRYSGFNADKVPGETVLPDFNPAWKIPISFAVFLTAYLRNKGRTYDVFAEFGDLTALIATTGNPNNIIYNATNYTLTQSPYGDMVQPNDPGGNSEHMYDSSVVGTYTLDTLVASGDIYSSLWAGTGGTVSFERLFTSRGGKPSIIPYKSPVLYAVATTEGFDCRAPLDAEVAALVCDYSAPVDTSNGIVFYPYPQVNQDKFVIGAVNILNHCHCPVNEITAKQAWKFPGSVRKILNPGKRGHKWHAFGSIYTLRITATTNTTHWYAVLKNICELLCAVYSKTALTPVNALEANEMNAIMQMYVYAHTLEWGWQHYTRPYKLLAGQFITAVTSNASASLKSLMMPANISELARQWRPVVIKGQILIPDMPLVAYSTLANFITAGTGSSYTLVNTATFQNTASPNGYATSFTGLYATSIVPTSPFTATSYSIGGLTFSNTTFGASAGVGITATKQSPTLPSKLTNLFVGDWKNKYVDSSNQKMFSFQYPILGDIGMLTITNMERRTNWFAGAGWLASQLDYKDSQMLLAPDKIMFWRGTQYARVNFVSQDLVEEGIDWYPFKNMITQGDGGILDQVTAMTKDNMGLEYDQILGGLESNPKYSGVSMKPLLAVDNINARFYNERGGAAMEEFTTYDAIRCWMLALKENGVHMTDLSFTDGGNNLFQPNSLTGWMNFLTGATATYNTGKYIFTDIWKTFGSLLGLGRLTLT